MELPIIYHDNHFVAISKPSGLLVHRTRIAEETKNFAMQLLRDQLGQWVYPLHRLDRGTSGVLLFGLHQEAAREMTPLFAEGKIEKKYLAVVRGYVPESDLIEYALKEEKHSPAQEARTEYRRLATVELPIPVGRYQTARYSLVEARPLTGRMHQIRKHFAHLCHYVIGDKKHGDWRHNLMFAQELGVPFMMLHSLSLAFIHPFAGTEVEIKAPLPAHWRTLMERFGWPEALAEKK